MALAKRLITDAILAAIFARYWGAIRWVFLFFGVVFVLGVINGAVSDFRAHGMGQEVDLAQIKVQTRINDRLSQVYWDVENRSKQVVGDVRISCMSNGSEHVIAPDEYIEPGRSASGVYVNSLVGYDTVCKLTSAMSYRK
jgi:hypothetical protein